MPMLPRWALRLFPALLTVATSASADLTGHWHVEIPGADPFNVPGLFKGRGTP